MGFILITKYMYAVMQHIVATPPRGGAPFRKVLALLALAFTIIYAAPPVSVVLSAPRLRSTPPPPLLVLAWRYRFRRATAPTSTSVAIFFLLKVPKVRLLYIKLKLVSQAYYCSHSSPSINSPQFDLIVIDLYSVNSVSPTRLTAARPVIIHNSSSLYMYNPRPKRCPSTAKGK